MFVFVEAIISYNFIMNPYQYSFELIKNIKTPNYNLIRAYTYTAPSNSSIFDGFKTNYSLKTVTDKQIMDYVIYNQSLGGFNSERFFICNIFFGIIQFISGLICYNLKNFYGKWKMDVFTLILV